MLWVTDTGFMQNDYQGSLTSYLAHVERSFLFTGAFDTSMPGVRMATVRGPISTIGNRNFLEMYYGITWRGLNCPPLVVKF